MDLSLFLTVNDSEIHTILSVLAVHYPLSRLSSGDLYVKLCKLIRELCRELLLFVVAPINLRFIQNNWRRSSPALDAKTQLQLSGFNKLHASSHVDYFVRQ